MTEERKTSFVMFKVGDRSSFIVSELLEETDNEVILASPVVMVLNYDDEGSLQVIPSKWMPFTADDVVQVPKERLVAIARPTRKIIDHYRAFIKENPDISDGSLEDEVLRNSPVTFKDSEWVPSEAFH